jgi:hypothetical protein
VSSDARTQPGPRARAIAGAPVDALLARTDELARRWAIGLILALPLERIGEIPLESFAREAPLLCAQVVRALASDEELERIAPSGAQQAGKPSPARRISEVSGARDAQAAAAAMEALRGVLWEALQDELRWQRSDESPARQVADLAELADRLAYVCSSALGSSLAQPSPPGEPVSLARAGQAPSLEGAPAAAREVPPGRSERSALGNGGVIVDEGVAAAPASRASGESAPVGRTAGPGGQPPRSSTGRAEARRPRGRALPWDTPLQPGPSGTEPPGERT